MPYYFTASKIVPCLLFRLRCRIIDIKDVKRYKYGDELTCRVCKQSTETVEHILCECTALVSHQCSKGDEYSEQLETLEEVIVRLEEFIDITEEQEEEE